MHSFHPVLVHISVLDQTLFTLLTLEPLYSLLYFTVFISVLVHIIELTSLLVNFN